jgi:uncharacterized membrane protein YgcG
MSSAYDPEQVHRLTVLRECRQWMEHHFIRKEQFERIKEAYQSILYHPNLLIRLVLFVATTLGLAGVGGLFILLVDDAGKDALQIFFVLYGIGSFFALEKLLIKRNHYKSGVTEAVMFQACGFMLAAVVDESELTFRVLATLVFAFAAFRYLDWISTLLSVGFFAAGLFSVLMKFGTVGQSIIPFAFMIIFGLLALMMPVMKRRPGTYPWGNNLWIIEASALLLVYLSGNYYVVRELSIEVNGMPLPSGENIPFAYLFYFFTAAVPVIYVTIGIIRHNNTLIRVGALCALLSVLTFKYYFSIAPPEITLTVAGAVVIIVAAMLLHYLRVMRNGITRENVLGEKWAGASVEGFLVSQTMGGNEAKPDTSFHGGGGSFGGGGASGDT